LRGVREAHHELELHPVRQDVERDGWLLTQTGLKFCKKNLRLLKVSDGKATRRSQREQTWISRERLRMLAEPAYQKFATGQMKNITPVEAERFFRVDDYVIGAARRTKIERSIGAFTADPLLGEARASPFGGGS
jgi:hypothetical protein